MVELAKDVRSIGYVGVNGKWKKEL